MAGLILAVPRPAVAQEWAMKMFDEQRHDFGTVATGSDCSHRFKITNLYRDDVHITDVHTSCSCASARMPEKTTLKSRESTYIEVSMNTQLTYHKDSNLIVTFDSPQYAQVRIPVSVYIRTDIVMTPGAVNFGAVEHGTASERKIELAYAGREDWTLRGIETNNPHLTARYVETGRGQGRVNYELFVSLKPSAPVDNLRQQIFLMTDDQNSPRVPLLVQARVEADIVVTPTVQALGTMAPGSERIVNFVVRGRKPFAIEKIEVSSDRQACKVALPKDAKPVHMLPITITAPKEPGAFSEQFTLTISGRPEPIVFTARGTIVATSTQN